MPDDQVQSGSSGAVASESTVNAFSALDEATQRSTLAKMSPELKQALLSGIQTHKAAVTQSPSPIASTYAGLGRGLALGAASGLGIPESTSPSKVALGALKNTGRGLLDAGKSIAGLSQDTPAQAQERTVLGPLGPTIGNMARGIESAGGESWQGLMQRDPEQFAHGLGSLVTQVLSLGAAGEGGKPSAAGTVDATKRLSKTAAALDIGGKDVQSLRDSMPAIVDAAKQGGVKTIQDFVDAHQAAKTAADSQYKQMLAPIAGQLAIDPQGQFAGPGQVVRNILELDKPYLQNTAEGRKVSAAIQKAAREFKRPVWTYDMLDDQRIAENQKLTSFFGKDTQGQSAAMANARTAISKAISDGARDTIYDEMERQNPDANVRQLKQTQGALWSLGDAVNSKLADLDAKQLKFEGRGPLSRAHAGLSVSSAGRPHSYIGGLLDVFSSGPGKEADKMMQKGWQPRQYPFSPVTGALPVGHLAGDQSPQPQNQPVSTAGMTPPPTP